MTKAKQRAGATGKWQALGKQHATGIKKRQGARKGKGTAKVAGKGRDKGTHERPFEGQDEGQGTGKGKGKGNNAFTGTRKMYSKTNDQCIIDASVVVGMLDELKGLRDEKAMADLVKRKLRLNNWVKANAVIKVLFITDYDPYSWTAEKKVHEYLSQEGVTYHTYKAIREGFTRIGRANHPKFYRNTTDANVSTWIQGTQLHFSCINPLKREYMDDVRKSLIAKAKENGKGKRMVSTVALLATLAHSWKAVIQLLAKFPGVDLDALMHSVRQDLWNHASVMLFIAVQLSRVGRGSEAVTMSLFDVTYNVRDLGEVPLVARCFVPYKDLGDTRPATYNELKWSGKAMQQHDKYVHYTLPDYASALSLPDVMLFAMRVMLALQPDVLLSPDLNPFMRMFMKWCKTGTQDVKVVQELAALHTVNGKTKKVTVLRPESTRVQKPVVALDRDNKGNLITITSGSNTFNSWLKLKAPDHADPSKWITCYSTRNTYAAFAVKYELVDHDKDLEEHMRARFGHTKKSSLIEDLYAIATDRVRVIAPARP